MIQYDLTIKDSIIGINERFNCCGKKFQQINTNERKQAINIK